MSKCPFILGTINKKLFLSLFLCLGQIAMILIDIFYPLESIHPFINLYMISIGEMLIKIVPYVLKISNVKEKKKQEKNQIINQKKWKHYLLLGLIYFLNLCILAGAELSNSYLRRAQIDNILFMLIPNQNFIIIFFEMVFMVLVSICLLKYRYYKHHIISMVLFLIFGIIAEVILKIYSNIDWKFIIVMFIRILGVGVDATYYCYQKYLMEKLYCPYWNVAFVPGVVMFLFATICLILFIVNPSKMINLAFIEMVYLYFKINTGLAIGKLILFFVLNSIMSLLAILIIYYFGPNFVLTTFQISRITWDLINIKPKQLYVIIFFILQFISMMIHLEIIELNFCGLNKYTKRNIELRGIEDLLIEGRDSTTNSQKVDINKDYDVAISNTEKEIEMRDEKSEN